MLKTNSCLNSLAIIKYVAEKAPEKLDFLFDGLEDELVGVKDKKEFLADPNNWISSEVLIKLYKNAKKILNDPNVAYKIGYDSVINRRFGYIQKILIYAFGNPHNILKYAQKINDKFNKTKTISLESIGKNEATVRLFWHKHLPLSRDFCLFNQGIYSAIPTIWGGKSCIVKEEFCYFKGDLFCQYHLFWTPQSLIKNKIFQIIAPWKIAKESIQELERDKKILQEKYEKIYLLNKELQTKVKQLSALYETSTTVLSTLDLTDLLDKVLKKMMDIANLDRAGVFLVDKNGANLNLIHAAGVEPDTLKKLKNYNIPINKKNNIIARAAQSKKTILVEDTDNFSLNRKNPLLLTFKPKAFIIVPLTVRDEVIGIMIGDNSSNKNFIKEIDKELLTSFANHIAIAIENANLYRRLEKSERKYRQIVENINEGILILTEGGSIIFSNKKMNELMECDSLIGQNIYNLVLNDEDRKKLLHLMMTNFEGKQGREEIEFYLPNKRHSIPILMSSVPIFKEDNKSIQGVLALITDLSHQKELERRLLQAQKLESIGTMAGGIAHDFNNILTGILGFTTLMKEKAKDRKDLMHFIDIIEKSSLRAAELVKKMLIFSRDAASTEDEACNPQEVIQEVFTLIKSTFPKNIKVNLINLEKCPPVKCGASQFQQIVMNLCINARDAMPTGGTLDIILDICSHGEIPIFLKKRCQEGNFVRLTVSDTGSGMPKEILDRIFDPFFTTKEVGKGSGLGLAVVYGLMESIGGLIDVKSKVGLGTSFFLYFPVATASHLKTEESDEKAPFHGTETVLITDDEEMIRALASEILQSYGYNTVVAKNGVEAVSTYKALHPKIHLVLMDILMPEMDGITAAKEILQFDPNAKILFCSGYTSMSEIEKSNILKANNGYRLIKKPFKPFKLVKEIRSVLEGRDFN